MAKKWMTLWMLGLMLVFIACGQSSKSYRTTVGEGADQITLVVLQGTPYQMGKDYGRFMKKEVNACLTQFLGAAQKAEPQRFSNAVLDSAWKAISPYVSRNFKEELRGLSEGAGIDLQTLRRAHTVPVVADYACSGVIAWGKASANGHVYHIRNLDFVKQAHLQDYPVVVIYNPQKGIPHAVASFAGYIGAHTGINADHIALGEKGESPASEYPFDLNGTHFSTLFRDLLYTAQNLNQALIQMKATPFIKRYHLFVSDGNPTEEGGAKLLVSSPDSVKLRIWKDDDPTDELAPRVLKNVVYYTMKNDVAYRFLKENYGKLDAQKMIALSRAVADEGGNLCDVVYDVTSLDMWVAFAEKSQDASQRTYVHIPLEKYFK